MPLMLKNTTLPVSKKTYAYRPSKFCDEIELYETANVHPHLAKLSRYCCDRRLAVVYDEELTTALSDVLPADDFGWDKRMNVATQLADLLAWLHKKKIAVGSIIASCIMIDKEVNINVFDFGYICNRVNEDSVIPLDYVVGRYPEDVSKGMFTCTPSSSSRMFHIIQQSFPIIVCVMQICNTSSIMLFGSRFPILKPTTFLFFFGVCVFLHIIHIVDK
uniref:Serine-threonine/tyrosine-protein kinase catalytic domain-containing protein n=1 Tax=Solanum tuberosum TaxID=4113 RepID=M1AL94_SOLTU